MNFVRALSALLVLPFLSIVPATAADLDMGYYSHGHYGYVGPACIVETEEMDMILLRTKPNNYSRIWKRFRPGECVIVTARCDDGWCPVSQKEFHGWLHKNNLVPVASMRDHRRHH